MSIRNRNRRFYTPTLDERNKNMSQIKISAGDDGEYGKIENLV
jgi:hypothetical protein